MAAVYVALGDSMSIDDYAGGVGRGAASLLFRNRDTDFPDWAGRIIVTAVYDPSDGAGEVPTAGLDAFAGMISEKHVPGAEFGELQLAIWTKQFQALRDGDRFHYRNDPVLAQIRHSFGIDFRHTLAEIIAANTDIKLSELRPNVFVNDEELPPGRILGTRSGRCLDVSGGKSINGSRVQLLDCDDERSGQGWQQLDNGAIRVFENKCLDVLNHRTAPGSPVAIWDCNGGANQRWRFNGDGTIVGAESGKCLTPAGGGTGRGTRIETQACTGEPNQRWIR